MKKMERKWARVCFVLLVAALVLAVTPWALHALLHVESKAYPTVFGILAALCLLTEFLLSRRFLRCPHCGKSTAPPRWSGKQHYRCTRCATIFPFDDQPELPVRVADDEEDEEDDDEEWEEYDEELYDDPDDESQVEEEE